MKPGKSGIRRIIDATGYSIKGLKAAWQHEAAFRQEVILFALLTPVAFWLAQNVLELLFLILPLMLLLVVELINSAIESTVDRIGSERHEFSGRAKDMGSAAVMVCLSMALICWSAIIWNRFFN